MKPVAWIVLVTLLVFIAAVLSCSVTGQGFGTRTSFQQAQPKAGEEESAIAGKGRVYKTTGVASWYGQKWHGKETASGDNFDHREYTAAHRTLPFGTKVRVRNLENERSVTVEVTDRGPNKRGRLIDLSHAAAEAIGLKEDGTGKVEVEAVEWPEEAN